MVNMDMAMLQKAHDSEHAMWARLDTRTAGHAQAWIHLDKGSA
jgi:hypothetical protein